jgi:hypothetical protein
MSEVYFKQKEKAINRAVGETGLLARFSHCELAGKFLILVIVLLERTKDPI